MVLVARRVYGHGVETLWRSDECVHRTALGGKNRRAPLAGRVGESEGEHENRFIVLCACLSTSCMCSMPHDVRAGHHLDVIVPACVTAVSVCRGEARSSCG